jgi:ABC-type lipoprotein release transport system permease subunit
LKPAFLIQMALLYVWRSWRSTVVIGVMVVSAVAALVFLASLAMGTNDAMIRNSIGLFSGHIAGEDLPEKFPPGRLQVDGVKQVLLRRLLPVRLRHGDRVETLVLLAVSPSEEKEATALWKKTVAGRYLRPNEAAVYLSEPTAKSLLAGVGDPVGVYLSPGDPVAELTVCGLYRTGLSNLDYGIGFVPQAALPLSGTTLSAAVFLQDGVDPQMVLETYRRLPDPPRFRTWQEFMPDLHQLIELNFVSMGTVMVLVFGVVSLGISCAFVIFILKNVREHGIMKAMGVFPAESALLILTEVVLLTLAASAVGTGAGALAAAGFARTGIDLTSLTSHNQYFAVSGVIYPRLTFFSLWLPPLLAIVSGTLAAVWPSIFVIRQRAADILRSL